MRWSFKIARIAGIDVRMHATFLLLLGWIALIEYYQSRLLHSALIGVLFTVCVFATVVVHEFGHALTARRFGVRTREITLWPIGGVSRLERMPQDPRKELWISLAGPLVSLAIALVLFVILRLTAATGTLERPHVGAGLFLFRLMWVNVALALFNLLPAFPMDGGRVLRAILAARMPYANATHVAARVGQGIALVLGLVGLFASPLLVFIALFVWIGASQEAAEAQLRGGLEGIPVQAAMETEFQTLAPEEPLSRAVDLTMAGSQQDFPVVGNSGLLGVLTRGALLRALAQSGPGELVATAMERDFLVTEPSEMLGDALGRLQERECRTLPVMSDGHLVGLLTPENVGDFVAIQAAIGGGPGGRPGVPPGARAETEGARVEQELRGDHP